MYEMEDDVLIRTGIESVVRRHEGKVRDIYDFGDRLAIVSTDRISAFDIVLPGGIPGRGRNLTSMTKFWLDLIQHNLDVPHHLISTDINDFPAEVVDYENELPGTLKGRVMLVKKLKIIPIECVMRGYISGSLWKEYVHVLPKVHAAALSAVFLYGFNFPLDLQESQKLSYPIFTPATKAQTGHDENIDFKQMVEILTDWLPENGYSNLNPVEIASKLRDYSLIIYREAAEYAFSRGIIIADTKFEFGLDETGVVTLADEVLTPDSSRFWPLDKYQSGRPQESFDKQYLRDWLVGIGWDKKPPAPHLTQEVIEKTSEKYQQALEMLVS